MSRAQQEDITCPKCSLNQTVTFWTSINVTLDPELREKLFAGEINVFRCSSCDNAAPLTVALIYHDMTRQYCAWYYPFSSIEDAQTLSRFTEDGKLRVEFPEMMAPIMPKYMTEPPVVFHPHELLRYVEFREALHAHHHPEMQREIDLHAVELGQSPFGKAPERLDVVDVGTAFGEGFLFVDAEVLVEAHVHQPIVAGPAIRADNALKIDAPPDHRPPRGLGTVRDDLGVNFSLAFEDAEDRLLTGSPSSQPWQWTTPHPAGTKVAFIDFDRAAKLPALVPCAARR